MTGRRTLKTRMWGLGCLWALTLCSLVLGRQSLAAEAAAGGERILAIYLPGVYFSQIERKLELGNELSAYLVERLGESYRYTPRVYAGIDVMDADTEAGRIALGLVEAPLVAGRLSTLLPVSVATTGTNTETRLVVLTAPTIKTLSGLRNTKLVHAVPFDRPQVFFEDFVFEGELFLGRERLSATRDVASALSLASLKKAEAILLYEGDEAHAQGIGMHALYRTTPLPRPTLCAFDRRLPAAEIARLRDAMSQFQGRVHPGLRTFRSTNDAPYQALHTRIEQRPRRLPGLLELNDEAIPLPLPRPPQRSTTQVPLTAYYPLLDGGR